MLNGLIKQFDESYIDYLKDESGLLGSAEEISFPSDRDDLIALLYDLFDNKKHITAQGSRTGIVGSCVPNGGHILNLSKMNKITGMVMRENCFFLEVQPGVCLSDINQSLFTKVFKKEDWSESSLAAYEQFRLAQRQFFPPNPTETTATIGGMFSSNAGGPNSYYYGKTAKYIEAISIILPSREIWNIQRGQYVFDAQGCKLPNGKFFCLPLTQKNFSSVPLIAHPGMDLIDFFAASEGMLGIVDSLTIRLLPEPKKIWGVVCLFKNVHSAICFAKALIKNEFENVSVTAIEYFDKVTLRLIDELKKTVSRLSVIPDIAPDIEASVYVELICEIEDDEMMEIALLSLQELLVTCGGDEDLTWAAAGNEEMEKFRLFRHAAPEAVNQKKDAHRMAVSEIVKTAVDFSAPNEYFEQIMEMYDQDIKSSNILGAIFGHVGNCHLHVNFLPVDMEEMRTVQEIIDSWAKKISAFGGCIAAENGIGKLKKHLFSNYVHEFERALALQIKQSFDQENLLNPGNIL